MQKILFLGGSGFLGQHLIRSLASEHQIFAITRSPAGITKIKQASPSVATISQEEAARIRFDRIFNLVVEYGRGGTPLASLMQTNLFYPLDLLERIEAELVLNVSTALPPNYSNYAISKRLLEQSLDFLEERTSRRFINIRLHNMYGPGAESSDIVNFVISRMLSEQAVEVSDCSNSRDFVFLEDVVRALALVSANHHELPGRVPVEVGSGEAIRLRDLIFKIRDLIGSTSEVRFGARPCNKAEPHNLEANTDLLRSLGWTPTHSLEEGLTLTVAAMASKSEQIGDNT